MSQDQTELQQLAHIALDKARQSGADAAEVGCSRSSGLEATVRQGETDNLQFSRDNAISISVYFGKRKGNASCGDSTAESIVQSVEKACAIARYAEEDPACGLADADAMATEFPDLDTFHPYALTAEAAIARATLIEDAARADQRIVNSEGASVSSEAGHTLYANSHGFMGYKAATRHSQSCVVIAQDGDGLQRDYDYALKRSFTELDAPEVTGQKAAERTIARCGAKRLSTRRCPVLFAPEMARGLVGHLLSAMNGHAHYRNASYLIGRENSVVVADAFSILENPLLRGGLKSASFDGEGVATSQRVLVKDGVLQTLLLDSYSARRLQRETTGHAGGARNIHLDGPTVSKAQLLKRMDTGLLVTELMGQGVNTVTGDYSRGAAGFWVENGEIQYPVSEITIAGNLDTMLKGVVALGDDLDDRSHIQVGSMLIDELTIAGN